MVRPWPDRPDRRLRPCQPTWLPTTWYLFAHSFFLHFCLFFVTCAISLPRPHLAFQSTLNSYRVLLAKVRWTQLFADASCDQFKHRFCERYSGSVIRCDPEQKNPLFREALEQTVNCIDLNFDVEWKCFSSFEWNCITTMNRLFLFLCRPTYHYQF